MAPEMEQLGLVQKFLSPLWTLLPSNLTCRCVLELLQMLVNDTMQSNSDLRHDRLQILAIQASLDLLDNRNDLLNDVFASGRRQGVEVTLRFEVRFLLFALQIDLHPTDQRVNGSIQTCVQLGLDLLQRYALP